jgi:hypothetical protein
LSRLLPGSLPYALQSFLLLTIPGLLISLVGSTMLGIALLRNRFQPRATSWLLTLWIPLFIGIGQVTALGNAALPVGFAFGIAGRRIARETSSQPYPSPPKP